MCAVYTVLQDEDFISFVSKYEKGRDLISVDYSEGAFLSILFDKMQSSSFGCIKSLAGYKITNLAGL